jgi:hypothetical protein
MIKSGVSADNINLVLFLEQQQRWTIMARSPPRLCLAPRR